MAGERVDDLADFEAHSRVLQESGGEHQGLAHQLHRLFVRPLAAMFLDQRVLGGDPVLLGVHDGAVHVPESGFEQGC